MNLGFAKKLFPASCAQAHGHRLQQHLQALPVQYSLPGNFPAWEFPALLASALSNHSIPLNSNPPPSRNCSDLRRFWSSEDHRGLPKELHVLSCSCWFLVRGHSASCPTGRVCQLGPLTKVFLCLCYTAGTSQTAEGSYQKDGSRYLYFRVCCAFLLN